VLEVVSIRLGIPTVVDGDTDALSANLVETRPTFMAAVPRIFEKAQAGILQQAKDAGPARWATFQWALDVGRQAPRERQAQAERRVRERVRGGPRAAMHDLARDQRGRVERALRTQVRL